MHQEVFIFFYFIVLKYDLFYNLDVSEYIHRVGRTARGALGKGRALLILLENEKNLIKHLEENKIFLDEYEIEEKKLIDFQDKFEKLIKINISLEQLAYDAFKSYIFVNFLRFFIFSHNLLLTKIVVVYVCQTQ